ncbi:hypothetical protein M404DRAFT_21397 [Pisolithus tinctorius Marx 270]|uniref:Uncharacterized protein n=1 Tax=Pisolithus tinctorius Marx 270 TaxID=870435 RepID=A0A0C3JMR5_PISTI|nr:hypothetical protein M404DRAFT_21397 [Pisolithus tinctorius Marx 270]
MIVRLSIDTCNHCQRSSQAKGHGTLSEAERPERRSAFYVTYPSGMKIDENAGLDLTPLRHLIRSSRRDIHFHKPTYPEPWWAGAVREDRATYWSFRVAGPDCDVSHFSSWLCPRLCSFNAVHLVFSRRGSGLRCPAFFVMALSAPLLFQCCIPKPSGANHGPLLAIFCEAGDMS